MDYNLLYMQVYIIIHMHEYFVFPIMIRRLSVHDRAVHAKTSVMVVESIRFH